MFFSSGLGSTRTRLSDLRRNRKVIGESIPTIVADARHCWLAAESRARILQARVQVGDGVPTRSRRRREVSRRVQVFDELLNAEPGVAATHHCDLLRHL